ncbi:hypothetical protein Scep_003417 [Stephania cephalantha]|uniref:Glycosyl transferase family 1 domain-containing protein n=1 Tax=Stephania cephalantha TaxID=152367 RepID=A0AAP0KRY7_9MAGN
MGFPNSTFSNLQHKFQRFIHSTPKNGKNPIKEFNPTPPKCVLWMAPFLSGGGYSSEAWSYVTSLHEYLMKKDPRFRLAIEQHGDLENFEFWDGLPKEIKGMAYELYSTQCRMNETIVVCHSEPGAWNPPLFETVPCPPIGLGKPACTVGRTMFETDRVNAEHVRRCNSMDFVWVPSDFHVSSFVESGVDSSKVVKVVQSVDVEFFDPLKYDEALAIGDVARPVLKPKKSSFGDSRKEEEFVFLSIFKWEYRKGWDVLLRAYLEEFTGNDGVALYILTNAYHSSRNFEIKIVDLVHDSGIVEPVDGWAPVYVIDTHVAQVDLPRLYKAANAFVLPSRGEGWGRPIVEAMAMSLPVIATNWSGPTEYLTMENSYPLPVDEMSEVMEGPFKGHRWAEPSADELRVLMRRVMSNPEEGREKGRKAREDMIRRFSPDVVAAIVHDHITKIFDKKIE